MSTVPRTRRPGTRRPRTGFWRGTTLLLLVVVWLTPLVAVLVTSFRTTRQVSSSGWWQALVPPWGFTLDNYQHVLTRGGLAQSFLNSAVVTLPVVVLAVLFAALGGYVFVGMPDELFEAAEIDGASEPRKFFSLAAPLARPALAAVAVFQFMWVWNDLLVSLVFLGGSRSVAPLTVMVSNLVGARGDGWELLTAAAFVLMVVPMVVFFTMQRYFVRGMLSGAVK
jgi:ABC-type glycerol-3-phosphate transport system permease component